MAPTTRRTATAAKAKPAPEPEAVEDEFEDIEEEDVEDDATEDDDDLEELEEAEETDTPKTKAKSTKGKTATKAPAKSTVEFGSPWLAAHVTEVTGETYDARGIRMLLRKLAADGKLKREVGVTRERYNFSGPTDPTVVAVVAMIQDGTAKELKQAGLEKVKAAADAKRAKAKAAKEAAAAAADEMDEDDEDDVEETPAPKRRTATKAAAPAKATPATRRRTAAAK